MPEIDLEALIAKAEQVQDDRVVLTRNWTGKYRVFLYDYNQPDDGCNLTYEECIKQIRSWGVSPKPKTLTFTLDTDYCECIADQLAANGKYMLQFDGVLGKALNEALKPYQPPE